MKQSAKQIENNHRKIIAKMVNSFILQAVGQPPEKVKELYESFNKEWHRRVKKVNDKFGHFILSYDVWEREWKDNAYHKYITIPVPQQLPESERKQLLSYKKELIRIVYIVEGKTEHQRQRRLTVYKILFLKMRIKLWFKKLFAKKIVEQKEPIATMQVV